MDLLLITMECIQPPSLWPPSSVVTRPRIVATPFSNTSSACSSTSSCFSSIFATRSSSERARAAAVVTALDPTFITHAIRIDAAITNTQFMGETRSRGLDSGFKIRCIRSNIPLGCLLENAIAAAGASATVEAEPPATVSIQFARIVAYPMLLPADSIAI